LWCPYGLFGIPKSKFQIPNPKQIPNSKSEIQNHQTDKSPNRQIVQSSDPPTVLPSYNLTVLLKGITNGIDAAWVVGNGTKLEKTTWLKPWWSGNPGLIEIEIPAGALDEQMTVIAVLLDGKIAVKY